MEEVCVRVWVNSDNMQMGDIKMKMLKILLFILCASFVSSCGKNYTGEYIYFQSGEEVGGIDNQKSYSYKIIKYVLRLTDVKGDITGTLIITDDKNLKEFQIKTGYADKEKKLHLQAVLGSKGLLSNEILLNLDETDGSVNGAIEFKLSGTASSLFGAENMQEERWTFKKFKQSKTDEYVDEYKKELQNKELEKIERAISENNCYKALIAKNLLYSVGGKIDDKTEEQLQKLKAFYTSELPEKIKNDIAFEDITVKEGPRYSFFGVDFAAHFTVRNESEYDISKVDYDVIFSRNGKVSFTGKGQTNFLKAKSSQKSKYEINASDSKATIPQVKIKIKSVKLPPLPKD
jgi:hypothetical protein